MFINLKKKLGLVLADDKSVPPTQVMDWLGYTVNSNDMLISISKTKLTEVLCDCRAWLKLSRADKKTIQAMVGRLVFISNCILPGRKFICRILGTLRAMGDRQWTTLTSEFKADLQWFAAYAEKSNGLCLLNPARPQYDIECDASLTGAGGNSTSHCYQWVFSAGNLKRFKIIHHLEAINVLIAIRTLVPHCPSSPCDVVVWTDNLPSHHSHNHSHHNCEA